MTYTDEEIIKALDTCADESEDCANCPFRTDIESCNDLIKISLAIIKRQRAELEKRQWISVEDSLPENLVGVLCWYEYYRFGGYNRMFQNYGIGYCFNGNWCGEVAIGQDAKVIAWMPLPEPPKGV